ncbi:MAG TPA: LamG domain-containing protein [Sedimentisphaerales bacterium]|nr:LamG domain-containing protein [Sedimentisphaerales bacterium]
MSKKLIYLVSFVLVLGLTLTNSASAELVGWWKLDDGSGTTALDSSGKGNDGTLQGDPQWVEGQLGGALEFDGSGDYVDCGNAASLDIYGADAQVTIALWVNTPNVSQVHGSLVTKGEWGEGYSLLIKGEPRKLWAADSDTTLSADPLTNNEWYHVAVTTDGATGEVKFYINGQLSGVRKKNTTGIEQTDIPISIAREQYGAGRWYFNGTIDDVRIYNRILTQERIQEIMKGEVYLFASSPTPADGALYPDTWVSLAWRTGDFAVSHDVYLGENFVDVNEGTGDTFQGNQTAAFMVIGFPGFTLPDGLVPGTTYYWRIDEVNDTEPNSPWKGPVWSFTVPPMTAWQPTPADGTKFVNTNAELSWTEGFGAKLHTVYFGDNFDDVKNAAGGLPQGETTYTPGTLEAEKTYYWRVDEFDAINTYKGDVWSFMTGPAITDLGLLGWWKFDEGQGSVAFDWSGHSNHGTLVGGPQWVAGNIDGALEFDGTDDYVDLNDPLELQIMGNITLAAWIKSDDVGGERNIIAKGYVFDPHGEIRLQLNGSNYNFGSLDSGGQHEVSDDSADADIGKWVHLAGTYDGSLWNLYRNGQLVNSAEDSVGAVPVAVGWSIGSRGGDMIDQLFDGLIDDVRIYNRALTQAEIAEIMVVPEASRSKPSNGAVDVKQIQILSWSPGDYAVSHEVYFGTEEEAVRNADTASSEYKGSWNLGSESYDPGMLEWDTTYYWRVDEVNNANPDSPWTGNLWSFTTANFLIVDDFEDYDVGNYEIWWSWKDGLGYAEHGNEPAYSGNGTGSAVGDESTTSYTEETIVHGGRQSMPVFYDNSVLRYSEVEMTLSYPRDWTEKGVNTLTIWFIGDAANAAETLYVALNGSAVVSHDNPNAAQITAWTEWNIDLQTFADQGVNLANVNAIALGLGNKNNPQAGGSGTMYFDDIRLYPPAP